MAREFENIGDRLDYIEFRQELLFNNSDLDRSIFEYELTRNEYRNVMNLMDSIRQKIENHISVSHTAFEAEMYKIVPSHRDDYHMCEYLARAFMDEGRWEEVFPALYGHMPKYQYLKGNN